jgi:tetratricopeptide (TPR) repeat protein
MRSHLGAELRRAATTVRVGAVILAALLAHACGGAPVREKVPRAASRAQREAAPAAVEAPTARAPRQEVVLSPAAASAYAAGLAAFEQADLKGASEQFGRALGADRGAYPAHVGLGIVHERRGELAKALESFDAALALAPDYGPALAAKVRLLIDTRRPADAEAFARAAVGKFPDNAAALAALAEVHSARGDSASAQQLAQKALKKDPDYRPAMVTLARDHYRAHRQELALFTLAAILDGYGRENPPRDKNNADARLLRATIFREQGRRKAAMEELQKVLELRPDLIEARLRLAAYMLEAGNASEARPLLEKALEYDPANVFVHLSLGDAYRLLGKPGDALAHLHWVSRKDERVAQTHYNLGLVYLFSTGVPGLSEEQAIDKAIEAFERFKKLEPHAARGAGDDVDDLISRARNKKAIIEALKEPPPEAAPAQPAGDSG